MKHLPGLKLLKSVGLLVLPLVAIAWLVYQHIRLNDTEKSLNTIKASQTNFTQNFSDALFEDHLKVTNSMVSDATVAALHDR